MLVSRVYKKYIDIVKCNWMHVQKSFILMVDTN